MDDPYGRFLLGVILLPFFLPQATGAAPPAVNSIPLPARGFPSEKELNEFLEPKPPIAIPDDPPPHEGAMVDVPYVVEPPDLLLVEVLEALPGRPISGERLVRPDGTISLGFYGDVYVRGLTEEQAKTKILLHLRKFVSDDFLGLYQYVGPAGRLGSPPPPADANPFANPKDVEDSRTPSETLEKESTIEPLPVEAPPVERQGKRARRRARRRAESMNSTGLPAPMTPPSGEREQKPSHASPRVEDDPIPPARMKPLEPPVEGFELVRAVHPADSDRVFLDVTAYNSKVYYVLGDVATAGRMPFTGNETVLDALNYASGFVATANRKDIRLIRPSRGGKPARTYQVDYEAITEKGDLKSNYQLFPGDRIVVGRNELVKQTIEIDRLAAPLQTIFNTILQYSFMARSVQNLEKPTIGSTPGTTTLTPAQREAVIAGWAEFWSKALAEKNGVTFDETKLRDALLRALDSAAKGAEESKPK